VLAGAATGAILSIRSARDCMHPALACRTDAATTAPKRMPQNAIVGGLLLGLIEGFSHLVTHGMKTVRGFVVCRVINERHTVARVAASCRD
jgi:hypothetical protein